MMQKMEWNFSLYAITTIFINSTILCTVIPLYFYVPPLSCLLQLCYTTLTKEVVRILCIFSRIGHGIFVPPHFSFFANRLHFELTINPTDGALKKALFQMMWQYTLFFSVFSLEENWRCLSTDNTIFMDHTFTT